MCRWTFETCTYLAQPTRSARQHAFHCHSCSFYCLLSYPPLIQSHHPLFPSPHFRFIFTSLILQYPSTAYPLRRRPSWLRAISASGLYRRSPPCRPPAPPPRSKSRILTACAGLVRAMPKRPPPPTATLHGLWQGASPWYDHSMSCPSSQPLVGWLLSGILLVYANGVRPSVNSRFFSLSARPRHSSSRAKVPNDSPDNCSLIF